MLKKGFLCYYNLRLFVLTIFFVFFFSLQLQIFAVNLRALSQSVQNTDYILIEIFFNIGNELEPDLIPGVYAFKVRLVYPWLEAVPAAVILYLGPCTGQKRPDVNAVPY